MLRASSLVPAAICLLGLPAAAASFSEDDLLSHVSGGSVAAEVVGVGQETDSRAASSGPTSLSVDVSNVALAKASAGSSVSVEDRELSVSQLVASRVDAGIFSQLPNPGGSAAARLSSTVDWRVPELDPDDEVVVLSRAEGFASGSSFLDATGTIENVSQGTTIVASSGPSDLVVYDVSATSGDVIRVEFSGASDNTLPGGLPGIARSNAGFSNRFRLLDGSKPITAIPAGTHPADPATAESLLLAGGITSAARDDFSAVPDSTTHDLGESTGRFQVEHEVREDEVPLHMDLDIVLEPGTIGVATASSTIGFIANRDLHSVLEGTIDYGLAAGMTLGWSVSARDLDRGEEFSEGGMLTADSEGESGTLVISELFSLAFEKGVMYDVSLGFTSVNLLGGERSAAFVVGDLQLRFVPEPGVGALLLAALLVRIRRSRGSVSRPRGNRILP